MLLKGLWFSDYLTLEFFYILVNRIKNPLSNINLEVQSYKYLSNLFKLINLSTFLHSVLYFIKLMWLIKISSIGIKVIHYEFYRCLTPLIYLIIHMYMDSVLHMNCDVFVMVLSCFVLLFCFTYIDQKLLYCFGYRASYSYMWIQACFGFF